MSRSSSPLSLAAVLALVAGLSACTDHEAERRTAARDALQAAADTVRQAEQPTEAQLTALAEAARQAALLQGHDPALDTLVGDAQANLLLRGKEGADWLKAHPAPDDPEWQRAARDAALRAGDLAWLDELLQARDIRIDLDLPAVEQTVRLAKRDRAIDADTLVQVAADCALLDARPPSGRRQIDYPVRPTFFRALELLGASRVVVGNVALVRNPRTGADRHWQCHSAFISADDPTTFPDGIPARGMVVGVTDGLVRGWIDIEGSSAGPWARSSHTPELAERWLLAAEYLEELGGTPAAEAAVVERYGNTLKATTGAEGGTGSE
ncbi:MAG: hypothetical protein H6742_00450 [Alphaproteobacteria bacterium]|nr:hypothetical protein [Alphaproteobacteria bacterium]